MNSARSLTERRFPWARPTLIVVGAIAVVAIALVLIVPRNTQLIVGLFQGYQSQNSFQPLTSATDEVRDDGVRHITEVPYGNDYPNSFLDLSYPAADPAADETLPIVVFFHGGGFFGGDKSSGDPMAVDSDFGLIYNQIVSQGYAFANVNYALVPEYHFPTPIEQMDQALGFLRANASDFGIDMDRLVIMGSSAGAIMTAQYGAILSNPEYAAQFDFTASIPLTSLRGLIVDDAPLEWEGFSLATKILIGNYLDGSLYPGSELLKNYDPIPFVTSDFPATLAIGSNYEGDGYATDMEHFSDALAGVNVTSEFFYQAYDDGSEPQHGFLNLLGGGDPVSAVAFERVTAFLSTANPA